MFISAEYEKGIEDDRIGLFYDEEEKIVDILLVSFEKQCRRF